jgi:hypothetical protein
MGIGVTTDLSAQFSVSRCCSTCSDYLAIGGTDDGQHAQLASYSINTTGNLEYVTSTIFDATEANYCERCCCSDNNLIIATDNGLLVADPDSFDIIASNTSRADNIWTNACWCCDNSVLYSSATNSNHQSYIFKNSGSSLQEIMQL